MYICENVRFITTFPERKKDSFFLKDMQELFYERKLFYACSHHSCFNKRNNMLYTATSYDSILIKIYACSRSILHVKSQIYSVKIQDKSHTGQFYACPRIK